MAIIRDLDEIEDLIPKPDYRLYGSNITEAPSRLVMDCPLFAVTVSRKHNIVVSTFRVMFILVKRGEKFHLMVTNYYRDSNIGNTDYITIPEPKNRKLELSDWPFTLDDIGLRLDSTCYDKNMIYFTTLADDVREIREKVKKRAEVNVVELEPVLV